MSKIEFTKRLKALLKESKMDLFFNELKGLEQVFPQLKDGVSQLETKWKVIEFSGKRGLMNNMQMDAALTAGFRDFRKASFDTVTFENYQVLIAQDTMDSDVSVRIEKRLIGKRPLLVSLACAIGFILSCYFFYVL